MKNVNKGFKNRMKRGFSLILVSTVMLSSFPFQVAAESIPTVTTASTETKEVQPTASSTIKQETASSVKQTSSTTSETKEKPAERTSRAEAPETWMPDENLRKLVAVKLSNKSTTVNPEDLTKEMMANLIDLTFDVYPVLFPAETVIDFTGLQYATGILSVDTTYVRAINIPEIKLGEGAFAYVRPNVLSHLTPTGTVKQLAIQGNNGSGIPSAELTGVGAEINRLNPTDILRVISTDMTDFSSLGITVDVEKGVFASTDYTRENPLELPALSIAADHEGDIVYSQNVLKAANGYSLLSDQSGAPLQNVQFLNANKMVLGPGSPMLTEEGMVFFSIPDPAEYILVNYGILARGFQRTDYGLSALIPIQRATPAADVTVKYLNEADEEIQTEKKISGNIGDAYDATTADYKFDTIDDYELDLTRLPTNATGTLDATAKTVVYRYKKNPVPPVTSTVTVKYVDEDDAEIYASKTITGNVGDTYDATTDEYKLATIDDYVLDESKLPTNGTGTIETATQTVIYHYKKNSVPPVTNKVTVKYVDEADKEIRTSKTITGNVGDAYDATTAEYKLATIAEYVLDESKLPTNGTGTIEATTQTVVYHYKKNPVPPVTNKVTVKYVDEADKEIRASKTITGNVGDAYDATTAEYKLATIDEYVLDESKLPTNGTGTIEAATQTVIYHYKKNSVPSAASKVTVQYVDEAGKELRDSQTITGKVGADYDVTTAEYKLSKIGDYQLVEDKLPTNAKGKFGEQDVVVTYVYKKGTTLANTSTNTANPGRHSIVTLAKSVSQKVLPKTGENNVLSNLLVFAGLVISVSALMIFVRKRRI